MGSAGDDSVEARFRVIEQRLDMLEGRGRDSAADSPVTGEEPFWILRGLTDQFPGASVVALAGHVVLESGGRYEWQQLADAGILLDSDWTDLADALMALAHPARLALLRAVLGGAATSAQLAAIEGFGTSGQVYHHLRALTAAGWVRAAGRGRYEVPAGRVVPLLVILASCQR